MKLTLLMAAACEPLSNDESVMSYPAGATSSVEAPVPSIVAMETIRPADAGRVAWSPVDPETIAFDAKNPDRTSCSDEVCFDVYVRHAGVEHCVTCSNPAFAQRPNRGQPAFHPSGAWLVIQAEEEGSNGSVLTRPGRGLRNELWLISLDGEIAYPLRYADDFARKGVLHPHFSKDGTLLAWAELYDKPGFGNCTVLGCWRLRIADFSFDSSGAPRLAVRPAQLPLGEGFYETHDFTIDDTELLFTSSGGQGVLSSDIYALEIATGIVRPLTANDYNEHAHPSPDGQWLSWMSSADVPGAGADLWIMDTTGARKTRLTWLNDDNPFSPGVNLADHEWSPDAHRIVQYVGVDDDMGPIVIFTLD